jgi:hypothetical protein
VPVAAAPIAALAAIELVPAVIAARVAAAPPPPVTRLPTTEAALDAIDAIPAPIDENIPLNIELIEVPIPLNVPVITSAILDAAQSASICRIMFLKVLARLSNASRPFSNKSIKKPEMLFSSLRMLSLLLLQLALLLSR